jgi:hypothetical protein
MSRLLVPRMLDTGSAIAAVTTARAGTRCLFTVATRTPPLLSTGARALAGAAPAQWAFRDDVLALARDTADVSWRELRRGLDDFDARTRPAERGRSRPYRVKP